MTPTRQFDLEALEPRILLSGGPVALAAAGGGLAGSDSVIVAHSNPGGEIDAEKSSTASSFVDFATDDLASPSAPIEALTDGNEASPGAEKSTEDPESVNTALAVSGEEKSDELPAVSTTTSGTIYPLNSSSITSTGGPGLPRVDAISSTLVETLRSANGPPFGGMLGSEDPIDAFASYSSSVDNSLSALSGARKGRVLLLSTSVGGAISTDTTWSGTVLVTSNVTVSSGVTLTIAPGAVVKFADSRYLLSSGGTISAKGTVAEPIILTSYRDDSVGEDVSPEGTAAPGRGNWDGVLLRGGTSSATTFEHVEVRYGGGGQPASIDISASSPTLTDVTIRESASAGVRFRDGASGVLTRVTVDGAESWGFSSQASSFPSNLNGLVVRNAKPGSAFLLEGFSLGGDVSRALSFGGLVGYVGTINVSGGATLTIPAGQVLKLSSYLLVNGGGTLKASGTAEVPVILTSWNDDTAGGDSNNDGTTTVPGRGDWQGILLWGGTTADTKLEHVEVRYAGASRAASIDISASSPTLTDVTVLESATAGVRLRDGGSAVLTRVTVDGSESWGFSSQASSFPSNLSGLVVRNAKPGTAYLLEGFSLSGDGVSRALSFGGLVGYVGTITVSGGATLTIPAGQVVKLSTYLYVQPGGTLKALGTTQAPVILTSWNDDTAGGDSNNNGTTTAPGRGDWQGVLLWGGTTADTKLEHVEVRYAGAGRAASVDISGSSPTLTDVTIRESASAGVRFRDGGSAVLARVTVDGSESWGFSSQSSSLPGSLSELVVRNAKPGSAFLLEGFSLSGADVVRTLSFGGLLGYVGNIDVSGGATLTIPAGQIVKFSNAYIYIHSGGILKALGTTVAPVVLTSWLDDTAGGDSNNDGNATSPGRGNWEGVLLWAGTTSDTKLENVEMRYAGARRQASIEISASSPTLIEVTVRESATAGVRLRDGGPASLTRVTVDGSEGWGFSSQSASLPESLSGLVVRNAKPGNAFHLENFSLSGADVARTLSFGGLVRRPGPKPCKTTGLKTAQFS